MSDIETVVIEVIKMQIELANKIISPILIVFITLINTKD